MQVEDDSHATETKNRQKKRVETQLMQSQKLITPN